MRCPSLSASEEQALPLAGVRAPTAANMVISKRKSQFRSARLNATLVRRVATNSFRCPSALMPDIRRFIVDNFLFGQGGDQLADHDSLLDKGLIDSTGVLELVTFLEQRFQIHIEDQELVPENL